MLKNLKNGLALVIWVSLLAHASDKIVAAPIQPVGFFVNNLGESDDASATPHAKFIRDGQDFVAVEGHEVFPGDIVVTDSTGGIQIAFLDNSAVRLHESTEFRIESPVNNQPPSVRLSYGHASFAGAPVPKSESMKPDLLIVGDGLSNLINLGIGPHSTVSTSCLAKVDIIVTRDPNGTTFTSNVAVIKGSVTLNPKSSTATDLNYGTQALLTLNNAVSGVGSNAVTLSQGNLTKDQIAALAAKSVSDMTVCVNTNGSVTINAAIKNSDGSITVGKVTEVSGKVTKDSWTTKDANNKTIATWSESATSINMTRNFEGYTLKASVTKKNDTGASTFKAPNGQSYKGTVSYDPNTGQITFKSAPAKDGSTAVYTYDPSGKNGGTQTVIIVPKSGNATLTSVSYNKTTGNQITTTEQGNYTNGSFVGDPNTVSTTNKNIGSSPNAGTTPDGHTIDQNQPPVSQ